MRNGDEDKATTSEEKQQLQRLRDSSIILKSLKSIKNNWNGGL
jgi:hypothetical protein